MNKTIQNKTNIAHVYKGVKNFTHFPEFIKLCKMTQKELKEFLPQELVRLGYTNVLTGDGYIYAVGDIPILLTAHMDTVHDVAVKDFYEYINDNGQHIISSPQGIGGDDRCGIYMILDIVKEFKPSILFCEDEEEGGKGSSKFCKTDYIKDLSTLKYLIELDRMNGTDAVFYDCANYDFIDFIEKTTGYKEAWGSFSDISYLAPESGVAAVNLSCGYYHAHTLKEEVNMEEMFNTITVVKKLLETECEQFEYVELPRRSFGGFVNWNNKWSDDGWYDYYDRKYYYEDEAVTLYVEYVDKNGIMQFCGLTDETKESALLRFFQENPDVCWNDITGYDFDVM